jgi:hypothetical protein
MQVDIVSAPTLTVDMGANNDVTVQGEDVENAAVTANPVLTGGRYDSSARTLGTGDVGAIALNASGHIIADVSASTGGTHTDDAAFTVAIDDGVPIMGVATSDTVDAGDAGALAMDTSRNLKVSIEVDNAGIGGGTQYTEDAAAPANPVGTAMMMERDDALGGITPIAGDWSHPFCSANGALWTAIDGTVTVDLGANNDVTVTSGTITANLGATDNAVLDNIDSNTDYGAITGGGVEASALRVTLANDSTGVLSVDDNGGSLTVDGTVTANLSATDNAVLDNIDTNTTNIPNVIGTDGAAGPTSTLSMGGTESGGNIQELRVDADGHLQVDVLSGGGSGTEYTEDAAAPADPVGSAQMLVRDDAASALTTTDGDWVAQRATNYGAAYTQIVDSSGNFIDSFGGSGGTAAADDADFVAGTTQGTPAMGVYESTPSSVTDGDMGHIGITSDRELKVSIETDNVGIGGGTQYNEDAATPATITGNAMMLERDDALSTLTPIEGDWAGARCSAEGALWVQEFNSDAILADTANIDTNVGTIAGAVSGTEMQVDVVTSALPTGAATAANQLPDGHNVTVDNASIAVTNAGLTELAAAINTNELDVNIATDSVGIGGQANTTSTNNSTTSILGVSGNFTGTADDVSAYTSVTVTLDASHDSSASGMTFQFSTDNTNWDDTYSFTYTAADGARRFQFPVTAQYFRVNYTNGGTGQTHFRVQTILHGNNVLTSIHRLADDMKPDRSAQVMKTALFAQQAGSGDFTAIDATAGGNLRVSLSEASDGLDIGAGNAGTETIRVSVATDDVNLSGILADTAAMDTNLSTIAGAVAGTEMQVDIVSGSVTADLGANNDVTVTGGNAHDGTTLGNPVLGGARATNSVEGITQVANADLSHTQADLNGVLLTRNATTLEELVSERVSDTAGTSTNFSGAFAAGGAGIHAYITSVTIHNSHASTNGYVDLRDGSAGSVVWTFPAPAGGGTTHNFNPPLKFAANTAVAYDVSAAISTVYISVNGFFAQG